MALGKNPWAANAAPARRYGAAPWSRCSACWNPSCLITKRRPQEVSFDPSLVSAPIAGQPIQRNLARPHREGKGYILEVVSAAVNSTDARYAANAQQTHVLRSQPRRILGALVDAIQEQQPPDCSSQCVNHGRRRADAIALTSRPSKRRLLNGVAVWMVRGFASPAASSPSTQLTRRFARRRRRSPSPSKSSTP